MWRSLAEKCSIIIAQLAHNVLPVVLLLQPKADGLWFSGSWISILGPSKIILTNVRRACGIDFSCEPWLREPSNCQVLLNRSRRTISAALARCIASSSTSLEQALDKAVPTLSSKASTTTRPSGKCNNNLSLSRVLLTVWTTHGSSCCRRSMYSFFRSASLNTGIMPCIKRTSVLAWLIADGYTIGLGMMSDIWPLLQSYHQLPT